MLGSAVDLAGTTAQLHNMALQLETVVARPDFSSRHSEIAPDVATLSQRVCFVEAQMEDVLGMVTEIKLSLQCVQRSMAALEEDLNRRNAKEHNDDAKKYNARVNQQMNILPLHDTKTNKPIVGFPKTIGHIVRFEVSQLDYLIRALNAGYHPNTVDINEKMTRLINAVKGVREPRIYNGTDTYFDR